MVTYFAYGSNMCTARMRHRVPGVSHPEIAGLGAHVLRWHKRSDDGSGKCDAFFTGGAEDELLGVVYRVPDNQKRKLDGLEGLGKGYDEKVIRVVARGGETLDAVTYVAAPHAIDPLLLPYDWYKEHVLCGAGDQSLPPAYVRLLEQQASIVDPDTERATRERAKRIELHRGRAG